LLGIEEGGEGGGGVGGKGGGGGRGEKWTKPCMHIWIIKKKWKKKIKSDLEKTRTLYILTHCGSLKCWFLRREYNGGH
jgi:hypothetical protein